MHRMGSYFPDPFFDNQVSAMLSATIKVLLHDVRRLGQRIEEALLALRSERRCAQRLDALATRLMDMDGKIADLRAHMHANWLGTALDADLSLRDSLKELKYEIREIRCQLACLHGPDRPARIERALRRLAAIAEEAYASADKLQWEVDDHDDALRQPSTPCGPASVIG